MTSAMEGLAAGNLDVGIPGQERTDQIGSMAAAVAVFRSNAMERLRLEGDAEQNRTLSEQERNERERTAAKTRRISSSRSTRLPRVWRIFPMAISTIASTRLS